VKQSADWNPSSGDVYQRLPFVLREWMRVIWSAKARATWEPRIERIKAAWNEVERWSVVDGVRAAARQSVSPEGLPDLCAWAAEHGLSVVTLAQTGATTSYAAAGNGFQAGQPWEYVVAIVRVEHAFEFVRAWRTNDDETIGRLLGFPACCREFFRRVWVEQRGVDTSWQMAVNTVLGSVTAHGDVIPIVDGRDEANILWRWMGVRAVPHLPCAFNCEATAEFGRAMLSVMEARGFSDEARWSREILSWPVEWSAYHGIAEIKTPICKVSTRTDATKDLVRVQKHGSAYPVEGERGIAFPYRDVAQMRVISVNSLKQRDAVEDAHARTRATAVRVLGDPNAVHYDVAHGDVISLLDDGGPHVDAPHVDGLSWDPREWTDNGFQNADAMRTAHATVLEAVSEARPEFGVLDLGAGNGALLEAIAREFGGVHRGVEVDAARVSRSVGRHPRVAVSHQDIFQFGWQADRVGAVLLMPGRLLECTQEQARDCARHLEAVTDRIVAYAYGDWLLKFPTVAYLAQAVGLTEWIPASEEFAGDGVRAIVLQRRDSE
jgi:hypothetical protein